MKLKTFLLGTALAGLLAGAAEAQVWVKIGVMNDRSGLYADISGEGSAVAARMAAEDFKAKEKGITVEIISADHQNKPDVGSNIARQWYDTGGAMVKAGGDTWFFLTADYAFGHALERDTEAVVIKNGGKVLGKVRHPFPGQDFSSFLLQAQASKAKVIGLANAGGDTINSIKQAGEFGIVAGGQKLAGLLVFSSDVQALGLQTAQGLVLTESFYWDLNDQTREFSKRFGEKFQGKVPTMVQAGVYSAVLHYLKAVDAAKSKDPAAVLAKMKEMPTDDPVFGKGSVRADGRKLHPMYLFEVKKPAESKGKNDLYKLVATLPAETAFRPLSESECPLVKKS